MTEHSDSYYNTTRVRGARLAAYEDNAAAQDLRVYAYFERHRRELTPEDVHRDVMPASPRGSVARALANLTRAGLLVKTSRTTEGQYGRPIHFWKLAPEPEPEQGALF